MVGLRLKDLLCGAVVVSSSLGLMTSADAAKRPKARSVSLEPWPGQRVALVLPLSLGANWNADPTLGRAMLDDAETRAQRALRATKKVSIIQLHRFDPIFVRAVQERRMTEVELTDLTNPNSTVPWLTRARAALSKLTFEQSPLIADFSLEEIRTAGDKRRQSLQVQVSGRFYELAGEAPRTLIATSDSVNSTRDPYEAILDASENAFSQVAVDLTKPLDISELSLGQPVTGASPVTPVGPAVLVPSMSLPRPAQPVAPTLPDGTPLPGSVPIAGASSRNTLGIAVPVGPSNTTTLPATPGGSNATPLPDTRPPGAPAPTAPTPGGAGAAPVPAPVSPTR